MNGVQRLLCGLLDLITGKGGVQLMAMFFAQRVILGKTEFSQVPDVLKAQVAEILIESGLPELVPPQY